MTAIRRALPFGLAALVVVAPAWAEEIRTRIYALPERGTLHLTMPASWKDEVRQPPNRRPPTIVFKADTAPPFEVHVSPMWPPRPESPRITPERLRGIAERFAEMAKPQAVEATLELNSLKGSSGPGYYFSATARAPAPNEPAREYRHMTQGTIQIGGILAAFTVLTNEGQSDVVAAALSMITGATHTPR